MFSLKPIKRPHHYTIWLYKSFKGILSIFLILITDTDLLLQSVIRLHKKASCSHLVTPGTPKILTHIRSQTQHGRSPGQTANILRGHSSNVNPNELRGLLGWAQRVRYDTSIQNMPKPSGDVKRKLILGYRSHARRRTFTFPTLSEFAAKTPQLCCD